MSGMMLLLDGSRGVYIPRDFNDCFSMKSWNIEDNDSDLAILREGPENEWYWEAWDSILTRAVYIDGNGHCWYLYQDGDLWAYCRELMTDEEYEGFYDEPREEVERENIQKEMSA